jgi:hypothetical protein
VAPEWVSACIYLTLGLWRAYLISG